MFDLSEVEVKLTLAAKENGVSVSEMASEMALEIGGAITASGCLNGLEWLKSDEAGHLMDLKAEVEKHIKTRVLKCAMSDDCQDSVTHIDVKGFVYCKFHGNQRKTHCRSRAMKKGEIKKLENGATISYRPKGT